MVELIRELGQRFKEIGSVWWRCVYSVTLTILCSAGLAFIPQGVETLRLVGNARSSFPLFLLSVAIWSLAAWYSSRLTLGRVFDASALIDRSDTRFVNMLRVWLPRALAVLPGSMLTIQFGQLGQVALALACALTTVLLGAFVLKRRTWFAAEFRRQPSGEDMTVRFLSLQRRTVITVVSAIGLSFMLLFAIWWKPVEVTRYLSTPALLCFAFASWILFGDLVLTYFFRQARLPSMAALPLLLFLLFSLWNDNHAVALDGAGSGPLMRRAVDQHLQAWLGARVQSGELRENTVFPLFLVAAEGGGIRAAYWSSAVLAKLQDDSGVRFGRHLFAMSGVSGGSLGSAVFAALMADSRANALAGAPCARGAVGQRYQDCARGVLRRDFLSPTIGYMLYPDMLQRFLPYPIAQADRARAMEKAWQAGWLDATGSERFTQRFDQLWAAHPLDVPSLLLNATLVDGGNRVIASDLLITDSFPDAYDAYDPLLDLGQMSLGTAVHNSARFSYVSPAGTVFACRSAGKLAPCVPGSARTAWGRLIDGGYFENSGVETIRDLLFAIRPGLMRWTAAEAAQGRHYAIEPVVIVISNSPGAIAPKGRLDPNDAGLDMTFLSELLAPPLGLFNTRAARATFAVTAERRDMKMLLASDAPRFFWFGMTPPADTPLGWALADDTFTRMDALLAAPDEAWRPFQGVIKQLPAAPD